MDRLGLERLIFIYMKIDTATDWWAWTVKRWIFYISRVDFLYKSQNSSKIEPTEGDFTKLTF